uniref:DNA-directed RNA polymerase subunit alpha n=1 Tax=Oltmannsiellopsis viridis TaxID=51324 RepID=RPOA_OLTVI|nr:alpha subunit of RNA polymerase [Oltmannsiellopsis viridis]Q20F02.1 RecName: Full=DNA-directed RNA polymerase subunit alpha; Short=PEP; AltName: Full=Plastid-encoded RNA polymerase subunit alpha; Short=RNA polymerase subunit alpha [Oltmannsiellopsis viridis]ABB82004.1 alpha subunit of RNA polymerase [Oltmannsiellopsis viridis]
MKHILLSCVESRIEHNRSFYSRFQLGPFDLGQGLTVGNAFRRTLLSELSGVGITLIEIDGVCHEYSTLPGVRESVLDILLNLKQLVLTSDTTFTVPQVGYLNFTGPGVVTAKDLKLPVSVYCVDPDQPIATLSADATLNFKFLVCQGKNYIIQTPVDKFHEYQKKILNSKLNLPLSSRTTLNSTFERPNQDSLVGTPLQEGVGKTKQNKRLNAHFQRQLKQLNRLKETSFKAYKTKVGEKTISDEFQTNSVNHQNLTTFDLREKKLTDVTTSLQHGEEATLLKEEGLNKLDNSSPQLENKLKGGRDFSGGSQLASQALPVDTLFMPIKKVNYMIDIDPAEPDRESVVLEIWTNGSIHPRQAVHEAAKQLIHLFSPFLQTHLVPTTLQSTPYSKAASKTQEFSLNETSTEKVKDELGKVAFGSENNTAALNQQKNLVTAIQTLDIANLNFSLRTFTFLKKENINTVSELVEFWTRQKTEAKDSIQSNVQSSVLLEISNNLKNFGVLPTS